jgi:mRNA-degrading endonuclease toxin of MazEF toxin-antitoxin module
MSSALQQGRIVWFTSLDPNGQNEKRRPGVILTPTADIQPDKPVLIAAVSSSNVAAEEEIVRLSWNREGTTSTRLRRASHVVCTWLVEAPVAALEGTPGVVNPRELVAILAKVEAAKPPPNPGDDDPG